ERTPGSVTNLSAQTPGNAELALTLTDVAVRAHDEGARVTAIGRVYENYMQLAVRADSPIRTIAQLRGARISLGAPGSG
ncbi:ABC transporter substrate-binding protein, partial [Rhodococcus sp. PAE-6]|uniref:TAXI family TRAP transporter solute-binding subunit n=1 Tax=Rhodococcus sp. PAE-6 TaxID=2972477 RepID=UPI0021B4C037